MKKKCFLKKLIITVLKTVFLKKKLDYRSVNHFGKLYN
jgi:hypothetical protein